MKKIKEISFELGYDPDRKIWTIELWESQQGHSRSLVGTYKQSGLKRDAYKDMETLLENFKHGILQKPF